MSVASHLGIRVGDYDRRIRTFIPHYEEMLSAAAHAVAAGSASPRIVDLGIGTGALASRCLAAVPDASLIGLDLDPDMLALAARRLRSRSRVELRRRTFVRGRLPSADCFTAALALHHVKTRRAKTALYRRCYEALRPGGSVVTADCMPPEDRRLARAAREAWERHMRRTYSARQVTRYFEAWAAEDRYFPLERERAMLEAAGFRVEVVWRRGENAVVRAST